MIQASNESWHAFLERVRGHLPQDFENDCEDEGLADKTGAYIFIAFMRGGTAQRCAEDLVKKLGIDDGEL